MVILATRGSLRLRYLDVEALLTECRIEVAHLTHAPGGSVVHRVRAIIDNVGTSLDSRNVGRANTRLPANAAPERS